MIIEVYKTEELINKGLSINNHLNIHPEVNDNINNITKKISKHQEDNQIENYKLHMCRGHDLTKYLAVILEGNNNHRDIERDLRNNFNYSHFKKTKLYQSLKKWEERNNINILSPPVNVNVRNRVESEAIERIEITENRTPVRVQKNNKIPQINIKSIIKKLSDIENLKEEMNKLSNRNQLNTKELFDIIQNWEKRNNTNINWKLK